MQNVLLVVHLLIAAALVGVVLMQKSEGGALGIGGGGGGGGGSGGFLTGRGTANLLTRATAGLAACFFITSILLTMLARQDGSNKSLLDATGAPAAAQTQDGKPASGGLLDKLNSGQERAPLPAIPESR